MKRETYPEARARIFRECKALGFEVKATLKVPQVVLENTKWNKDTLFFHTQSVYLNAHSTFLDIRGMSTDTFLGLIREIQERRKAPIQL